LGRRTSVIRGAQGSRSGWVVGNDRGGSWGGFVCQVEMAAKPPLLGLRSQIGPCQDRVLRIESQSPHATSDTQNMLSARALGCSKCLPLQGLQCGQVLVPVASTATMK
jgi:hypothetical protein